MSLTDLRSGGGVPVPFVASRGLPQHATVDVGSRRFVLTIVAGAADVPALRSVGATEVLADLSATSVTRPTSVPADAAAWMTTAPDSTLAATILRPTLAVREGTRTLGIRPVVVGAVLRFGSTATVPLAVEVVVDDLVVTAGSLTRPGVTGARIAARLALRTAGVRRNERPPVVEEDPYDQLA